MRSSVRLLPAVLACTLALGACGGQPSSDASGRSGSAASDSSAEQETATAAPTTGIPGDFPLSAGMGGPNDSIPTSRTGTGLRDLELCGTSPLRGLGTRDRMVADNSGGEALHTRELVLLGSADEAEQVARTFTDLSTGCDRPTSGTTTEVRESPFGAAPAAVLVQGFDVGGEPAAGHVVVHVVPVGAALLVTQMYGEWADVAEGIDETTAQLAEVFDAMSVFDDASADSDPDPDPDTGTGTDDGGDGDAAGPTPIPTDFPLAVGLPEDDGETEVSPPSADGDGMGEVLFCGRVVWPHARDAEVGPTDRLVTGALGPEYFDGRELIVHADAEEAVAAMAVLREAAASCRTIDNQVWTVLDRDTGRDTVTVGLTYDSGLGSSVFQVTRVGSARLLVGTYGEGSLASLDGQADGVTGTTEQIVPAMCVFTKTGC